MPTAPKRIEVCNFPGGKPFAVTTSWDDGRVYDRQVVKAFNQWGLKGTFNLNSGTLGRTGKPTPEDSKGHLDASEVASVFAGHEVAIHTVTHPFLERLEPSQIAAEVLNDRIALEDLVGYPVRGMAYPFGTFDERVKDVLRSLGIVYSRTVVNLPVCFPPKDPLEWGTSFHQYNPNILTQWQQFSANHWNAGKVFFVWGHSYEFADRNDWASLETVFKPLSGRSDVWYCTNIELFDYENARKRIAVAANKLTAFNPSALSVSLNVDGKIVDVPGGKTVSLV